MRWSACAGWHAGSFLLSAAPGAGKTIPSLAFARRLLDAGTVTRVHVICPTTPLTRQWAEVAGRFGIQLAPDSEELHPPRDFHGIAATYARAASSAARWAPQCGERTLVIADEAHHLGEELAWGEGFAKAFRATTRWLLLSGTPFRSDGSPIAGVVYDDGVAVPDVSYTYADAVRDGICRPVVFVPYDGTLSWQSGDDVIESSFSDGELSAREAGRRYRTAISTELSDGLPRILRAADERLGVIRGSGHRDAGGLVVTADGGSRAPRRRAPEGDHGPLAGRRRAHRCTGSGQAAGLRLRGASAGSSRSTWSPKASTSHGCASASMRPRRRRRSCSARSSAGSCARSPGVRRRRATCSCPPTGCCARTRRRSSRSSAMCCARPPRRDRSSSTSRPSARESERTEPEAFVALAADVAPQLALFSGGPPARLRRPSPRRSTPRLAPAVADEPVFHRRRRLRDKRQGLVRTLAGMEGRSHREINTWVNRRTRVESVDQASIEQLERAIEVLQAELDRIGRRRARRAS